MRENEENTTLTQEIENEAIVSPEELIPSVEVLTSLIEEKRYAELREKLVDIPSADIAELFDSLKQEHFSVFFRLLPKESASEVFVLVDSDTKEHIITAFTDVELASMLDELYLDDTVDIIEEMPANVVKRILRNSTSENRSIINQLLRYPKDSAGTIMTIQASYNHEITGLGAIFGESANLYGINRSQNAWLMPYAQKSVGEISELTIQTALDEIEERSGKSVNFIVCSWGVRRALQQLFSANRRNIDTMELSGGFKAMNYNGIPIVADRFCPDGTMYLLNTNDFTLHQLCDWQWLADDDGRVLKQVPGKPVYTATLVKYAELICSCPQGQGMLSGITEV